MNTLRVLHEISEGHCVELEDRTRSVFRVSTGRESNIIDFFENQAFSAIKKEKSYLQAFPRLTPQMMDLSNQAGTKFQSCSHIVSGATSYRAPTRKPALTEQG
jgi:hypothetical protein